VAHEPDVFFNISRYWKVIQSYFSSLFSWGGLDEVMAEEMTVLPGMMSWATCSGSADHVDEGHYDLIVVDAAPNRRDGAPAEPARGEPLVDREDRPDRASSAEAGRTNPAPHSRCPVADRRVYEAGEQLLDRLKYVHDLLADPDRSSVRLVLNLERVSIQEAQRSFTYFHMYGFPTDMIVANRVLPAASGSYFEAWREAQARYLPMVEEQFAPVPVRTIPFFDKEMVGLERLAELGRALFGDTDPQEFLYRGRRTRSRARMAATRCRSSCRSRRATKSRSRAQGRARVQVGAWRRNLVLPRSCLMRRPRARKWRTTSSGSASASRPGQPPDDEHESR